MSNLLHNYKNGDFNVSIFDDGTLIRESSVDNPKVEFPTSLDCKITNYCDQAAICGYCHEKSNKSGKHGDLELGLEFFNQLPSGTEIAIGGGNPLDHPQLEDWLIELENLGLIANLTVNSRHLGAFKNELNSFIRRNLIKGLGISWTKHNNDHPTNKYSLIHYRRNIVYHLIAGIDTPIDLEYLFKTETEFPAKVLILGYKSYGNGEKWKINNDVDANIAKWKDRIRSLLVNVGNNVISFDNLAIKQLEIEDILSEESWNNFYMGNDGQFTMYVDLVKQEFTKSSVFPIRYSLKDYKSMKDIFQKIQTL